MRQLVLIVLLVGLSTIAHAESFVWRVAGDHNTVYLAGSMHLLPERAYPLPAAYESAYSASKMLVEEADQAARQDPDAGRILLSAARYDRGDLASHLDADMLERTADVLDDLGLAIDDYDAFRPWFVSMAIEVKAFEDAGYRADLGLDGFFDRRARLDHKPILALQDIDRHLAILTELPAELSRDQLAVTLANADELDTAPDELYGYWRFGNVADFAAAVDEQVQAYPALYDRLIHDRNQAWMATVETLLHSPDNAMVLVGAAHLVGPEGLVSRLRDKGYEVEQMD